MRRPALRRLAAAAGVAILLAHGPAVAQGSPAPRDPAEALGASRTLGARGDEAGARRVLEAFLSSRGASRLGQVDAAVLRLEAARLAAASDDPQTARAHMAEAARLAPLGLRTEPLLRGRLRRELARVAERLGDLPRAEALLAAALEDLAGTAPNEEAADVANALGVMRIELFRPRSAVDSLRRARAMLDRGRRPADARIGVLANLVVAWLELGEIAEARAAALAAVETAGGDPALRRVADYVSAQIRLRELDLRGLEADLERLSEEAPPGDPVRAHALQLLATSRFDRGRMPEASEAAARAVEAYQAILGDRHPAFARSIHTLGSTRHEMGDLASADSLYARAEEVLRAAFGPRAPQTQATSIERAALAAQQGNVEEAERRARGALAALRVVPAPDHRLEGLATVAYGLAAERRGRPNEAGDAFRRAQVILAEARGAGSVDLGFSLVRLGRLLTRERRFTEAVPPLDRAVAIYESVGAAGSVRLAEAVAARAELRAHAGERRGALEEAERALALLRGRIEGGATAESVGGEAQRRGGREIFAAMGRLLAEQGDGGEGALDGAFAASQEALNSRAGDALRRAAARLALGDGTLAQLLRERESAVEAVRQADALALNLAAQPINTGQAARETARVRVAREAAAWRLTGTEGELARRFPSWASYLAPRPASLAALRAVLATNEAVVAPVLSDEAPFLWIVTRAGASLRSVPGGSAALREAVQRVRASVTIGPDGRPPAFDRAAARDLHTALLGPAMEGGLLDGIEHLIIVPDGPLGSLPPHLLLDAQGRWLAERYAVTVMPTVAALVAARGVADRPSKASRAFLGIGDPQLNDYRLGSEAEGASPRRGPPPSLRRALAALAPLPETAEELNRIAATLGRGEANTVLLGADATETELQAAQPGRYRVLAFASHAIMAGELQGLTEPAVILTPGQEPPMEGLLTASDIATMSLDAELVLLSACNTAAPEAGPYAEGLSGLARAFLQAGARATLVSHWAVDSRATVALTTGFFENARQQDGSVATGHTRAEALRQSMLRFVGTGDPVLGHPAYWSPFVVIGG
ncbi:CHAT domain-containing protein [Roseomonas sp. WA12]